MEPPDDGKQPIDKDKSISQTHNEHKLPEAATFRAGSFAALKKDEPAQKLFPESLLEPARDACMSYLPQETLDIVDGIRPSSSRSRTLALLPAIEESVYEDKAVPEAECSDTLSSLSPISALNVARYTSVLRVSSRPALASISEELISKTCDSVPLEVGFLGVREDRLSVSEPAYEAHRVQHTSLKPLFDEDAIETQHKSDTDSETSPEDDYVGFPELYIEESNQPHEPVQVYFPHSAGDEGVDHASCGGNKVGNIAEVLPFAHSAGDERTPCKYNHKCDDNCVRGEEIYQHGTINPGSLGVLGTIPVNEPGGVGDSVETSSEVHSVVMPGGNKCTSDPEAVVTSHGCCDPATCVTSRCEPSCTRDSLQAAADGVEATSNTRFSDRPDYSAETVSSSGL